MLTLLPGATAWTPIASLPRALVGARASIVGGRLRVNGGYGGGSFRSEVMIEKWWWCTLLINADGYEIIIQQKVDLDNDNQWSSLLLFCLSGARVSPSTLEPVGAGRRPSTSKICPCHPLHWTRAAPLLVRWKFQRWNDNYGDVRVGGWLINKEVLVLMIIMMIIMIISNDIITWIHSLVVISDILQS